MVSKASSQKVAKERATQVHELLAAGMKRKQIAEIVGITRQHVGEIARAGAPKQNPARRGPTPSEAREACVYGIYFARQAVRLGCTPQKALDAVASAGLVRIGGVAV